MQEVFSILSGCPLFSGVEEGELSHWLKGQAHRSRALARGEFLFHMGDRPGQLGVVLAGSLHILYEDAFGGRSILAVVGPGELFAEAYACAGAPLTVSVAAREESRVLLLDAGGLLEEQESPAGHRVRDNLIRVLARKNLTLNEKIRHVTRRTTREKLLSYLSAQRQRQGRDEFVIPFDRQQLADYLSVDRSAMCTELGKLCREGLVSCRGKHFVLHTPWEES